MKKEKIQLKKNRIRAFFLTFESSQRNKKEIKGIRERASIEGMTYIQMRLPVEKITPEFEDYLKHKIEEQG